MQNESVLLKMGKYTGITCACTASEGTGLVSSSEQGELQDQVVIGTPGTLKRWMTRDRILSGKNIKILVFDEADHMLDQVCTTVYTHSAWRAHSVCTLVYSACVYTLHVLIDSPCVLLYHASQPHEPVHSIFASTQRACERTHVQLLSFGGWGPLIVLVLS